MPNGETIESRVPARLDALPWSSWHWLIVVSLGATWILDGLEVTLAGALGGVLTRPETLGLSDAQVGASATCYLAGAVIGALVFGYGTDRFGRKKFFFITVAVYLIGTALSAFSWNFWSYASLRALTGAGIGGEYAAINSAIDELIPARVRGRVDLIINGSYWVGAAMGAAATLILLDPRYLPMWLGWRFAFGIGATLGLIVILFRRWIPESPRWLMIHGRNHEAEEIVADVERKVMGANAAGIIDPGYSEAALTRIRTRTHTPWREIWDAIVHEHRRRSFLGFVLMSTQAFFYNAIFFTYALVLMRFYSVPEQNVGGYLLPFALGNVLGPLALGHLFDTIGRKQMITLTYGLAGIFLALTGWLFHTGLLTAQTQTLAWTIIFFVASAAASSAYLTVSEIFPLEIRAMAIAIFFAIGTLVGGVGAPLLFGWIIGTGSRPVLFLGYLLAAALMIFGAAVEAWIGVAAERRSLEHVAAPLSSRGL
ncbi:MAG: MFS transporter [Verrucomicrobia bacterium]|nr:MAG: MFS transporter [Verrucomicrobiota bacterium]PYK43638.1 MAG: MFS transporter [Verrucomicrobiota bacterium]